MKKTLGAIAASALAVPAFAVNTVDAQAALTEGLTNVTTIGGAVLVIAVTIAIFKYVKKAF